MRTLKQDRERKRAEYAANPEKFKRRNKLWNKSHPEFERERSRQRRKENPEYHKRLSQAWRDRFPDLVRDRSRRLQRRHRLNPSVRIRQNLSRRLNELIRGGKCSSILDIIGCNIEELRTHLSSHFQPGMSWENYDKNGWEIDHYIACAHFDLTDPAEQKACFHWSNLKPMWSLDNKKKGKKLPTGIETL